MDNVEKYLNQMTKEELIKEFKHEFLITEHKAKYLLVNALLERAEKINRKPSKIKQAKNRKELIQAIEEDQKRQKEWDKLHKRIDKLMER